MTLRGQTPVVDRHTLRGLAMIGAGSGCAMGCCLWYYCCDLLSVRVVVVVMRIGLKLWLWFRIRRS